MGIFLEAWEISYLDDSGVGVNFQLHPLVAGQQFDRTGFIFAMLPAFQALVPLHYPGFDLGNLTHERMILARSFGAKKRKILARYYQVLAGK